MLKLMCFFWGLFNLLNLPFFDTGKVLDKNLFVFGAHLALFSLHTSLHF